MVNLFRTARNGLFKRANFAPPRLFGEIGQGGIKMYAIIENGGKQYKVEEGSVVKLEKLNANVGDKLEFNVLLVSNDGEVKVGADAAGFKVLGEVLEQDKFKKIIVFKYKAKKNERKKQGHRQPFTAVKIESIAAK